MVARLLDHNGKLIERNGHATRRDLQAIMVTGKGRKRQSVEASFDAARTTTDFTNYWANADCLDADSAHSAAVRSTLVKRSRYESGSNGYYDGIVQTHANYVVGLGPNLRMQTPSAALNDEVEAAWKTWRKAVQFRRKLWCVCHAKVQDGEGFGVLRNNERLPDPVKLDLVLFETEQCTTPNLPFNSAGYVDGIKFDEFGNPEWYDILKYHPGGTWYGANPEPERVPAGFVVHWFSLRRPGQHRAVPEFRSTLNVGAGSRRWREATVAAAETAADYAALLTTNMAPGDADLAAPFSTVPIEKRMMAALPMGWDAKQMAAEHPNATYEAFHRAQTNEQARPKSMPLNIALCDSSQSNFASGKLDTNPYFLGCDLEREDCDDLVLEKIFARWFERARLVYGWAWDGPAMPSHSWGWPAYPIGDIRNETDAKDAGLKNGSLSLSDISSENGEDFEERVVVMARDYGVSVDEMRKILLKTNLSGAVEPAPTQSPAPTKKKTDPAEEDVQAIARPPAIAARSKEDENVDAADRAKLNDLGNQVARLGGLVESMANRPPAVIAAPPPAEPQQQAGASLVDIVVALQHTLKALAELKINNVVNVPEQQPAIVHNVVNVPEQAAPVVNVRAAEQAPPVVNNVVNVPEQQPAKPSKRTVKIKDAEGKTTATATVE